MIVSYIESVVLKVYWFRNKKTVFIVSKALIFLIIDTTTRNTCVMMSCIMISNVEVKVS